MGPEILISQNPPNNVDATDLLPHTEGTTLASCGSRMLHSTAICQFPFHTWLNLMEANIEEQSSHNIQFVPCLGLSRIGVM